MKIYYISAIKSSQKVPYGGGGGEAGYSTPPEDVTFFYSETVGDS